MYSMTAAGLTALGLLYWHWISKACPAWSARRIGFGAGVAVTSVALLYTHYLTALFLAAYGSHALAAFVKRRAWGDAAALAGAGLITAGLFLPWMEYVNGFRAVLRDSLKWMTVPSVAGVFLPLGREFLWECAPRFNDRLWLPGTVLAGGLIATVGTLTMRRFPRSRLAMLYLISFVVLPVAAGCSHELYLQPVYARPRFAMLLLHPLIILTVGACCGAGRLGAAVPDFSLPFGWAATVVAGADATEKRLAGCGAGLARRGAAGDACVPSRK
jgi:hypothetical protein